MVQTKALYNLLRYAGEGPAEDFRALPVEELFARLERYCVKLDKVTFHQFAETSDTPEELSDLLLPDDLSEEDADPFYLIIFELWRRILPEKRSLSVFCDEIDHRISLYDEEDPRGDELVQDALANLIEVLEENTDAGGEPEAVFSAICEYCAHDLESFFYEYISELLDNGNSLSASELIEGFFPYMTEPLWFDFLRVRLLGFTDIGDANAAIYRLLEGDLELLLILEIVRFLSSNGDHELFSLAVRKALPQLSDQEELNDLVAMVADYCRKLGLDDLGQQLQKIIGQQKKGPLTVCPALDKLFRSKDGNGDI